jgi:phosphate binding protein
MVEVFGEDGYTGQITIDSIGSGGGFERFCVAGETDISNASRAIEDEEVASCQAIGREPIEFRVGNDAVAVVVSTENDFLEDLTLEQLGQIFGGEAVTWADVDPSFPAEPIQLFSPGSDSGTYDFLVEVALEEDDAGLQNANVQFSENDNVLVQGVTGSPYAIGYFGFAYYLANQSTLKAISIDGVEPTAETAEDGSYPLSRPLFIYSDATIMQEKPQVAAFINYYLTFVNDEIESVGYFPASEEALNEARQKWLDAVGE